MHRSWSRRVAPWVAAQLFCNLALVAIVTAQGFREGKVLADTILDGRTDKLSKSSLVALGPKGGLLVAVSSDGPVVMCGADGKRVGALGAPSSGSLRALQIGWAADSPWVRTSSTIEVYSPEGKAVRSIPLSLTVEGPPGSTPIRQGVNALGGPLLRGVLPGGELLLEANANRVRSGPTSSSQGWVLIRATDSGAFRRVVGVIAGTGAGAGESCSVLISQGLSVSFPFCLIARGKSSASGSAFISLEKVDSARVAVTSIKVNGDTAFHRSYQFPLVPVLDQERDSVVKMYQQQLAATASTPPFPTYADSFVGTLRRSPVTTHPPVSAVIVGEDASAWLRVFSRDQSQRWGALGPTGNPIGIVTLPQSAVIQAVQGDQAWALVPSSGGAVALIHYKIQP